MNIAIVGGWKKADFLIKSLLTKKHKIVVIHDDYEFCTSLSQKYEIKVICGDGSKPYILHEANIDGFDLLIALTPNDADNLVICQLAKKNHSVKKTLATVSNPKNVKLFKNLNVDNVISSTDVAVGFIEQLATIDVIQNFIPLGEGQIGILEVLVKNENKVCNQRIENVHFPENTIIACILRNSATIIPKGKTQICANDRLLILSPTKLQPKLIKIITGDDYRNVQ